MRTDEKPRLYTMKELREGCGGGWYEVWLRESGEDPEMKEIQPCGFCRGYFVLDYGSNGAILEDDYNARYGFRIWTAEPTDEEREAEPWDAEE